MIKDEVFENIARLITYKGVESSQPIRERLEYMIDEYLEENKNKKVDDINSDLSYILSENYYRLIKHLQCRKLKRKKVRAALFYHMKAEDESSGYNNYKIKDIIITTNYSTLEETLSLDFKLILEKEDYS